MVRWELVAVLDRFVSTVKTTRAFGPAWSILLLHAPYMVHLLSAFGLRNNGFDECNTCRFQLTIYDN
jgi:hypothetical protein